MLKMMEPMNVSNDYFPAQELRSILDKVVTVNASAKVFHDPDRCSRSSTNDAISNGKFFTVIT